MGKPFYPRDRDRPKGPDTRIRINDGIYADRVRLIDENGAQMGIKTIREAQDYAASTNLDLVEVAPQADPPVCRIMNFSKYRYELEHKDKVKVTIMFRGRELVHPERGEQLLMRLAEELKELATIESKPNLDGRNMIMMLAPVKS